MSEYTNGSKESSIPEKHITHQTSPFHEKIISRKRNEDDIRWFLTKITVVLMFLVLGLYLITRDNILLLSTTSISGVALIVFKYYFHKKEK